MIYEKDIEKIILGAEKKAEPIFKRLEEISLYNQKKVLDAFRKCRVSAMHFAPSTGYGYGDAGRDTLNKLFSYVFGAESAIVSPNILSGTHALTVALFGLLKPGDTLLCVSGSPYDTLSEVINGENNGSLKDYNVSYDEIGLKNDKLDYEKIGEYLKNNKPKVVLLTRSRGYSLRDAFSIAEIEQVSALIKSLSPESVIAVDNCYGEFTDTREPTEAGADIIIGSLIKNPGGGLAPTGGYIAGKEELIDKIANRLTAPSIGREIGSYFSPYLPFYQGLFLAPQTVEAALKTGVLLGCAFDALGYEVSPRPESFPKDIIRAVRFNTKEELIAFIQGVQYSSPVDSHVTPYPWDMPGYAHQVIMAAGTFIQGASIELSADSPVKEPYIAYTQGALTYQHGKLAVTECLERIIKNKN